MRVSCTFVLIAVFFVAQSQCAPINPLDNINLLGSHPESKLLSAPIAHEDLNGHIPVHGLPIGTSAEVLLHQALDVDHLLNGKILGKRATLPPLTGSGIAPGTPSLDSIGNLGKALPLSSAPQPSSLGSLPLAGATPSVPGLSNLASLGPMSGAANPFSGLFNSMSGPANPISGLSNPTSALSSSTSPLSKLGSAGSVPGLSSLPLTGLNSGIPKLPTTQSLPGLSGLGPLSGLKGSPFSFPNFPMAGFIPGFSQFGGLPAAGGPFSGLGSSFPGAGAGGPFPGLGGSGLTKRNIGNIGSGLLGDSNETPIIGSLPLIQSVPLSLAVAPVVGAASAVSSQVSGTSSGLLSPVTGAL